MNINRILPRRIWDIFSLKKVPKFDKFRVKFVNFPGEKGRFECLFTIAIVTLRPRLSTINSRYNEDLEPRFYFVITEVIYINNAISGTKTTSLYRLRYNGSSLEFQLVGYTEPLSSQ